MIKLKTSIKAKVLAFTTLPILLLVVLLISSQFLFFNDFYINEKNSIFKNNFMVLKDYIDNYNYSSIQLGSKIYNFEESNNSKVAILKNNGTILSSIYSTNNSVLDSPDLLRAAANHWKNSDAYYDVLLGDKVANYQFTDPSSNIIYTVVCSALESKTPSVLFALSTLQPVDEASNIMMKYYLYFIVAALIILVLVSIALTKILTKPLIAINDSAKKMSELQFEEKCTVKSDDELGNIGNSLNFMSEKLSSTLNELKSVNEQLQDDIEKERELEKMRREFIGDISHELKTPISIVKGYAEALQDGIAEEDDVDFYTTTIIEEMDNLDSLVHDMLNLSKLENDPYSIKTQRADLKPYLSSLAKKYSLYLKENNFDFKIDAESSSYVVHFDSSKLEEVINNFITNAKRHTQENGVIELSLHKNEPGNTVISVYNEGSSISESEINNIWNKFYRIDKSRNKSSGGSGLGLAISKRILDLHGFDSGVYNTDSGVVFYIEIPHN